MDPLPPPLSLSPPQPGAPHTPQLPSPLPHRRRPTQAHRHPRGGSLPSAARVRGRPTSASPVAIRDPTEPPSVCRWRREVRIKRGNHRWQGETWYYGPCGKRMKQFPEVIKVWWGMGGRGPGSEQPPQLHQGPSSSSLPPPPQYLNRNVVQDVRREHFSFSPRMPVGDFYEERDTPEVGTAGSGAALRGAAGRSLWG